MTTETPEAPATAEQFFGEVDTTAAEPDPYTFTAEATATLRLGLDTVDITQLHGLQFYWCAGYVGGWWPTYSPLCNAYPSLQKAGRIFSYAVNAGQDADWLDCELGDATIAEVPGWLSRQFARGHKRPGVYANWDYWHNQGLQDNLAHYGSNIIRIVAHYTYVPQIAHPGFDVQQYTDRYASRNLDGNVALDSLFTEASPEVVNPLHYDRFATGPFPTKKWGKLNEREVVEEYDGARQHPDKYKTYLPQLEAKIKWLADRVWTVAHNPEKGGHPTWGEYHRGWRWQELIHRAHGMQFVKASS